MTTTDNATARSAQARTHNEIGPIARRRVRWGMFFLMPWIIGFLAFQLLPIISTIFLSFTDYSGTKEFTPGNYHIVGFANYARLVHDPDMINALGVTLKFALIAVPLGLIVPLLFAVLVNSKYLVGKNIFRTLFFLPTIIPIVAGTMVFQGVLNAESGWINLLLNAVGIPGPRWLTDPAWAVPALNILAIWGVGNAMVIYLGALQGVPTEIYEAAEIDGASASRRFFAITLPMISPIIFYNITLSLIGAFQYFVPSMLINGINGDPQGSTLFYNLYFYRQAFVFNDMGYASVLSLFLFVIVMSCTVLLFRFGQRGVYYTSSDF